MFLDGMFAVLKLELYVLDVQFELLFNTDVVASLCLQLLHHRFIVLGRFGQRDFAAVRLRGCLRLLGLVVIFEGESHDHLHGGLDVLQDDERVGVLQSFLLFFVLLFSEVRDLRSVGPRTSSLLRTFTFR